MARVGIYLCLRYYVSAGQFVLQSPYTLAEVINMTICASGIPLFSDIEKHNAHLDAAKLVYRANTGAMLVTHLHGIPAEMQKLMEFARSHNIPVIEDAAQSAGAMYDGKFVGTIGNAGVLSFGMLKQLNSLYGGMVLTDDAGLAEFLRDELAKYRSIPLRTLVDKLIYLFRLHMLTTNPFFTWGMFPLLRYGVLHDVSWINKMVAVELDLKVKHQLDPWYRHRMSPSQARMLKSQLQKLEEDDRQRIRHGEAYRSRLAGIEGLTIPEISSESRATFAHFPIQVKDPVNLLRWFNFYGQDIVAQHLFNCAELPCFADFHSPCPIASDVARSLILLPTYPGFGPSNVRRNIKILQRYFAAGQPAFDGVDRLNV